MINWNDLKHLDVKDIDLTKIDLGRLDIRKVDIPTFELPTIDLPKVDLPTFELPKFGLPTVELPVDVDRVTGFARDAAYAGVGVAVVAVQKLDEQRRDMTDQVTIQVRKLVDALA
jgi:hypothetical protein